MSAQTKGKQTNQRQPSRVDGEFLLIQVSSSDASPKTPRAPQWPRYDHSTLWECRDLQIHSSDPQTNWPQQTPAPRHPNGTQQKQPELTKFPQSLVANIHLYGVVWTPCWLAPNLGRPIIAFPIPAEGGQIYPQKMNEGSANIRGHHFLWVTTPKKWLSSWRWH